MAPKLFGYLDTLVTGLPNLLFPRLSARLGGLGDSKSYCGAKNASSRHRESEKKKKTVLDADARAEIHASLQR